MSIVSDEDLYKLDLTPTMFRTVSQTLYCNMIPEEMSLNKMNQMCLTIFGVDIFEIYKYRRLNEKKTIILTDFSSNGFFWGQFKDEIISPEVQNLLSLLEMNKPQKLADLSKRWCIAKYDNEWFRGSIEEIVEDNKLKIFFIDYGTTAIVPHSDTRSLDLDEIWIVPPLAIPFVIKDISLSKLNELKKMQYSLFLIDSIKLIEKSCIFEVQLTDESGNKIF